MDSFLRSYLEDRDLKNENRDRLFEQITTQKIQLKKLHQRLDKMTIENFEVEKGKLKKLIDDKNEKLNNLIKQLQNDIAGIAESQFKHQQQEQRKPKKNLSK